MWEFKIIENPSQVLDFLNENNIKPENVKITESGSYYCIFYYVNK